MKMIKIVGALAVYTAIMAILTKDKPRRLPYLNAMNFCITGVIALSIQHPLGGLVALTYFILSTLESNAVASTMDRLMEVK